MRALIDGDVLVYQSAFSAQYTVYLPTPIQPGCFGYRYKKDVPKDLEVDKVSIMENPNKAFEAMDSLIAGIIRATHAKYITVYLSKGACFRHKLTPTYKASRKTPKPEYYSALRAYLVEKFGAIIVEDIEADDALSIMHTHTSKDVKSIICTIDKDLLNTPGHHFNFQKGEFLHIDSEQAMYNYLSQMLTGDSADNIQGLKGVGPKTAAKLLACTDHPSQWGKIVRTCYEERAAEFPDGDWKKQFNLNRRLLWIMRDPGYGVTLKDINHAVSVKDLALPHLSPSQEDHVTAFS